MTIEQFKLQTGRQNVMRAEVQLKPNNETKEVKPTEDTERNNNQNKTGREAQLNREARLY